MTAKEHSDNWWETCITPEMPYCPDCEYGYVYISEEEAEFSRDFGGCNTEWICLLNNKKRESGEYRDEYAKGDTE